MANVLAIAAFILVQLGVIAADNTICSTSNSDSTLVKLRDSLTCQYDAYIGPINKKNSTQVHVQLLPTYFTYDDMTGSINLDTFVAISWQDRHLSWDPAHFDDIKDIMLHVNDIWVPDLSMYNMANMDYDPALITDTKCHVFYSGSVECLPSVHLEAICMPDLSAYPFDVQTCNLRIGSWVYKGEEMNITMNVTRVPLDALVSNGEWEMVTARSVRNDGVFGNESFPNIEVTFEIKRMSSSHAATIFVPLMAIMFLTISSLLIHPSEDDRMTLCSINVLSHFLQIQYTSYMLPLKGENVPFILIFSRDSMLLAVFALLFTVFFKYLLGVQTSLPLWLSRVISPFSSLRSGNSNHKRNVVDEESSAAADEGDLSKVAPKRDEGWLELVSVLNALLLIAYVVAYFIMSIRFIP